MPRSFPDFRPGMERRGYVRREPNPADRRSIMVRAIESAERELAPAYAGMMQGTRDVLARYRDAELAVILDFLTRATAMTNEQIARLREEPARKGTASFVVS